MNTNETLRNMRQEQKRFGVYESVHFKVRLSIIEILHIQCRMSHRLAQNTLCLASIYLSLTAILNHSFLSFLLYSPCWCGCVCNCANSKKRATLRYSITGWYFSTAICVALHTNTDQCETRFLFVYVLELQNGYRFLPFHFILR